MVVLVTHDPGIAEEAPRDGAHARRPGARCGFYASRGHTGGMRCLTVLLLLGLAANGCGSAEPSKPAQSASADIVDSAIEPNIDPKSVRAAKTVRTPNGRYTLLTGRSKNGALCLADRISDNAGMSAQSLFNCGAPAQLWPLINYGGKTTKAADWAVIAGVVRAADRVTIRLADGSAEAASIGPPVEKDWRVFTFKAQTSLPRVVSSGRTNVDIGRHIQAPCSGREDDPCLEGDPIDRPWSDSVDATLSPEPRLEDDEARSTRKIIAADPLMKELLARRPHKYDGIGLWFACGDRRIGTFAEIGLRRPATFEADWPYITAVPLNGEPYTTGVVHFRVENANQLHVHVDLHARKVVAVDAMNLDPRQEARVTDYRIVEKAPGAEGRDCDGQPYRD
jgi:hypothetical protein